MTEGGEADEEPRRQAECGKEACKANASDGASMSIKSFPNDVPRTCLDPVLFDLGASWRAPDPGEENHDGHTGPTLLVGRPPEDSMSYRPHKLNAGSVANAVSPLEVEVSNLPYKKSQSFGSTNKAHGSAQY